MIGTAMRYRQLISESRTAPLFHGTPLCTLLHVLSTDTLQVNHNGYISLSRSFHVSSYFSEYSDFPAYGGVLVLDQEKLTHRYRLAPHHDEGNEDDQAFHDEDEERLYRPVYPLSRYLISINIDPNAIKAAASDERYQRNSDEYFEWFDRKRSLFLSGICALLRHPAVNKYKPRLVNPNTDYIETVGDRLNRSSDNRNY